jgi:alkylated DNA repair dioxygenase AlkB
LAELKQTVEGTVGATFDSVLLNYYRDYIDRMGFQSNNEAELSERPVIASVSLGEVPTFLLKTKGGSAKKTRRLALDSGSLLVMKGETQRNWQHGIAKERTPRGPRVNLTFRQIVELEVGPCADASR